MVTVAGWQDYYPLLQKAQPVFPPGFSTPRPFRFFLSFRELHTPEAEFPRRPLLETVWKIRMGFTMGSDETLKRGEKPSYCRFCATKTRHLDTPSYFPNNLSKQPSE